MDRRGQDNFLLPARVGLLALATTGLLVLSACTASEGDSPGEAASDAAEVETAPDGNAAEGSAADDGAEDNLAFDDGEQSVPAGEEGGPVADAEVDPEAIAAEDLPELPTPDDVVPDVESSLPDVAAGEEILDQVGPVDSETDISIDRDGRTRNAEGELIGLDQPASLACANVEISVTALDEGDDEAAAAGIVKAAAFAEQSEMRSVQEWSGTLAGSVTDGLVTDVAPLIGFLTACAQGGYEL